ncbi:MAG: hypothetical protein JWO98_4792 [Frankiales bacterium]|nr:hypothetical protein [Frankiales bacterium]
MMARRARTRRMLWALLPHVCRSTGGSTRNRAELVSPDPEDPASCDLVRRRTQQIDVLYRQWSRNRTDVEALRQLHEAIGESLGADAH